MVNRRTVIVADDVAEIRNLVAIILEPVGFNVLLASGGHEASRLLRQHPCDLLIADVLMPDGDGLELISEARRANETPRILAISGGGQSLEPEYCVKMAKAFGADETMLKPFDRRKLVAAVQAALA